MPCSLVLPTTVNCQRNQRGPISQRRWLRPKEDQHLAGAWAVREAQEGTSRKASGLVTAVLGPPLSGAGKEVAMVFRAHCSCPSGSIHFAGGMSQLPWQPGTHLEGALDIEAHCLWLRPTPRGQGHSTHLPRGMSTCEKGVSYPPSHWQPRSTPDPHLTAESQGDHTTWSWGGASQAEQVSEEAGSSGGLV